MNDLHNTRALLQRQIADGLQIGAQMSVSRWGERVADLAVGESAPGVPMTPDSLMIWFSMSKITCAVAVMQQWEQGRLRIDAPVAAYLPGFAANGKEAVTVRHLLTHTAGIPWADGLVRGKPWRESAADNLARIHAAAPEAEWVPGERAAYHPTAGMTVLGAVVSAVDGRPYDRYVREAIFEPLGMHDCWVGMPPDRYAAYGERIGRMQGTNPAGPSLFLGLGVDTAEVAALPLPGANGRGPMRELLHLAEMLLGEGTREGVRVLDPVTVAAMTARHRTQLVDETFGIVIDWGLGVAVDSAIMGRFCSSRTFGHGGAESSATFVDPVFGVCVSVVCNGMCGAARHYPRMDDIASAVYEDLGLATRPARRKPYPTTGA